MWCSIKSRLSNIWIGNRRSIFEWFNHRQGEQIQRLVEDWWYIYRCAQENSFEKTLSEYFYGLAYSDETLSNSICITRTSEVRITTND